MNKELINKIAKQSIANIEHKQNDEHDTRWWIPELYDQEFARLIIEEVLRTATLFEYSDSLDDYTIGLEDAQKQIVNAIKIKFGVK